MSTNLHLTDGHQNTVDRRVLTGNLNFILRIRANALLYLRLLTIHLGSVM